MKTVWLFLLVGVGGSIGSVMRYGLSLLLQRYSVTFPHGTLWANLLGCFLIGAITAAAARSGVLSPEMRLLLATGVCGGFTTMSTFTYELFKFVQGAEYLYASAYFLVTFVGCAVMLVLGMAAVGLALKG